MPAATATAEPEDEPPGLRAGSTGLRQSGKPGACPPVLAPSGSIAVFPIGTAPAARSLRTSSASERAGGTEPLRPAVVGIPATS